MKRLMSRVLRSVFEVLLKPSVRYTYLPRLYELISYNRKEEMLHTCFEYISVAQVRGDYLEFGLWKGANLVHAYHLSECFNGLSDMRFYGFDSFEGIPSLSENEAEAEQFPPGKFRASVDEVADNLKKAKVDMARVSLIKGWYSDSLNDETRNKLALNAAALVYIDCDVFESTVPVLDFIEPHLVDGSVIIFDDWYCFRNNPDRGEQKAFREWLRRNRHLRATPYKEFGCDGKSFIINRAARERVSSIATAKSNAPAVTQHTYPSREL